MLVSPIQYTQTHGHVKCISIVNRHQKKILWWLGLVPALVKWLNDYLSLFDYHMIIKSQKRIRWWRWLVEAKWELPVSGCPGPRQQLNSGAIQRKPGAAPSTLLLCLSLSFSRCLFLQHEDFAGFFSLLKLRCPWMASPPPLVAYFLFEEL